MASGPSEKGRAIRMTRFCSVPRLWNWQSWERLF
jgi:hypothetical protein